MRLCCILVAAVSGCAAPPLVEHQAGCAPVLRETVFSGTFTLYSDCDRVVSTTSQAGEEVGFARHGRELVAIGGSEQWPLTEGNYRWVEDTYQRPWFQSQPHQMTDGDKRELAEHVKSLVEGLDKAAAHWK